ncbi:uncharacterized protein J3D65DRAFT_98424 [Phyllosticta citribraziliensis]|uniref:GPI anchored cell wall protein n=1 Tax=Phyllosticta citribraziliensis TaxID=989973 RepID=A0ABR1LAI5_9PEZI
MFLKVVLFALCAILGLAQIANAATPACVLAVVGQTKNPANLTDICNDRNIQGMLEDKCKEQDQVKAGLDTFSSVCLGAGITVPSQSETATSKTASRTANATASASESASETASRTGPAATGTESPGATSTSTPSAGREPYYGTVNVVQTILLSMAVAMTLLLAW